MLNTVLGRKKKTINVFQTQQYDNKVVHSCRQGCRDAAHNSDHGNAQCAESQRSYIYLTHVYFDRNSPKKSISLLEHFKLLKESSVNTQNVPTTENLPKLEQPMVSAISGSSQFGPCNLSSMLNFTQD